MSEQNNGKKQITQATEIITTKKRHENEMIKFSHISDIALKNQQMGGNQVVPLMQSVLMYIEMLYKENNRLSEENKKLAEQIKEKNKHIKI